MNPRPGLKSRLPQVRPKSAATPPAIIITHGEAVILSRDGAPWRKDFNLRYMLVDGQGNFGSGVTAIPPAAHAVYRSALGEKFRKIFSPDLEKRNCLISFRNFDHDARRIRVVLPSRIPNLLVNGCEWHRSSVWPRTSPPAQFAGDRGRRHSADRKNRTRR